MKKLLNFFILVSLSVFSAILSASPTSDFALNPILSNLVPNGGIFYTRTGSLGLSGNVSSNVASVDFSGTILGGIPIYFSGDTLTDLNTNFSSPTSLTGGVYTISAFDSGGISLGSEQLVIDKTAPRATSITYFDDNKNGKIDRFLIATTEPIFGSVPLPYNEFLTIETKPSGLLLSCEAPCDQLSFSILSAAANESGLEVRFTEGDNIKPHLVIISGKTDLRPQVYSTSLLTDLVGNVFKLTSSAFPNGSSTGIIDGTTGIDFLDTGYLYGTNFSGALSVQKIDSRNKNGSLVLNGITLTTSSDSFLGDGNSLHVGTGSKIIGNGTNLFIGSESHILSSTGLVLFGKEGFSSAFKTLSGEVLSSVSTVSESGIYYTYNGTLVGSGLQLAVDYVSGSDTLSLFSGALTNNSTLIELHHGLSGGNLRATVSRNFGIGESMSFSGINIVFDTLTQASVTFASSIVSTGSISDITKTSAKLSGVIFRPNIPGNIYFGTGTHFEGTGTVSGGIFSFSGLLAGNTYFYRLGLVPFSGWEEIYSSTGSFTTLPAAIPPPPISITFQSTTNLTDQNPLLNEFSCDTTHTDCKINFDLTSSFGTGYNSSDYFCELDFDLDFESGEEYKCNPNTVTFPRGQDYILHFRIIHTPEVSLFTERTILIHSPSLSGSTSTGSVLTSLTASGTVSEAGAIITPIITAPVVSSGGGSTSYSSSSLPVSISILDPVIVIQSGLDTNNRCTKADCSLNLEYKVLGPKEACHWDFSGGSYLSGTENKCNPGYIHYPLGEFTVTLRVFEQGNISNYREKTLHFTNGTVAEITQAKTNPINHPPVAFIKLQGTLGKTKIQQGKTVKCLGVDECIVNLSGEESYDLDHDKLSYFWNFGNGQTSDKENPPAIKYNIGEYPAFLRVTDSKGFSSEDIFHISVLGKDQKEVVSTKPLDPNVFSLKITGVSPNPLGNDGVSEWAEITNPLGADISLVGCSLDDEIGKGSNPYIFPETSLIRSNSKKRFYKLQTQLNFNNTGDSASLICDGKVVSSLSWDYSVPEGFVVSGQEGPYSGKVRTKVLRVVDGDTIVVELYGKEEKVRLIGVDTPETVDPRKSVQYYGIEASNFSKRMLNGREIELEFDFNPRDKYDRLLAYVWIDGKNYNSELIKLGYARAYLRFPFRYFKEFEKIGKEAEKNKVGLWADLEVKKALDADAAEDKKALEEQLREEDKAILDDLIEVAKDPKIASEKLDAEILDQLLTLDFDYIESGTGTTATKSKKVRSILEEINIENIHISLQGALSKNRKLSGNTFTCHTNKTCSINLTAGKIRKDTIYLWDFGNNETFYGPNPLSHKFSFGKHIVTLKIFDIKTGNVREEIFQIIVEKLVSIKKPKKEKIVAIKQEKPLTIKGQDYLDSPKLPFLRLSPLQTAGASGILVLIFFGGMYVVARKRRVFEKL